MIAHVDADSFFASVLVRKNPALRGKPLLALGMGGGCVIAASYEAKAKGVKTGMTLKAALKLAPEALRAPSDFQEAGLASEQIEAILRETCPRVEQMSVDEWYLDLRSLVGGVPKDLASFASTLRKEVLACTGLSLSVGIAPTKILAKMASEYRKPGGITIVAPAFFSSIPRPLPPPTFAPSELRMGRLEEGEKTNSKHSPPPKEEGVKPRGGHAPLRGLGVEEFLSDRPAAAIPGIGPRRIAHCQAEGWVTALDIAQAHPDRLKELFGRPGKELGSELRGEQIYPIVEEIVPPKSVSRARSFRPLKSDDLLWAHLLRHLEYTVLKMRRWCLACQGISVWLRDGRYEYRSTHCSFPRPLETEETIQPFVRRCFRELYRRNEPYTQAGLALWKFRPGGTRQFSLFEEPQHVLSEEKLQQSLDELHEKYGRNSITRGGALPAKTGTRRGFEMPLYT